MNQLRTLVKKRTKRTKQTKQTKRTKRTKRNTLGKKRRRTYKKMRRLRGGVINFKGMPRFFSRDTRTPPPTTPPPPIVPTTYKPSFFDHGHSADAPYPYGPTQEEDYGASRM